MVKISLIRPTPRRNLVYINKSWWRRQGIKMPTTLHRVVSPMVTDGFFSQVADDADLWHYNDVITGPMSFQITSLTIIYSTVYSGVGKKKKKKIRVTGLCAGNSLVTDEFPAQRASNAKNVSIWWRHHGCVLCWQPPKKPFETKGRVSIDFRRYHTYMTSLLSSQACILTSNLLMLW